METSVALDFLGDLRRTHTCGELRAADEGKTVVLMGWVHRRRDHGGVIFVDLRDRDGITQVVFHEDVGEAVHSRAEEVRPGVRDRRRRPRGAARSPAALNPQSGHRRSRSGGLAHLDSQRIAHAAVPHGGTGGRGRGRAPQVPLRRSAPPAHAAQHHAALEDLLRGARVPVRAGIPGDRNALHDALHARGRARLPGAQPRPAGHASTRCRSRRRFSSSC